jgi:N12 class adenine-specific DNA methylase
MSQARAVLLSSASQIREGAVMRLVATIALITALGLIPAAAAAQTVPGHPAEQFSAAKKKAKPQAKHTVRKTKTKKDPGYLRIP